MCDVCGCGLKSSSGTRHQRLEAVHRSHRALTVDVLEGLLAENDRQAAHNAAHFDRSGVLAINLMSSPGSGKTALLEATLDALGEELRIAVIEGDLETENDARRVRARGAQAVQITTGTACHLDAAMVHGALHELDTDACDLLFIENVGNLVCPASFDLGQHLSVALLSVTEGDDKPSKYPVMFRAADLVLLTKTDLLQWLDDFDPERAAKAVRELGTDVPVLPLSARDGTGLEQWLHWLRSMSAQRPSRARPSGSVPQSHVHRAGTGTATSV